ncbi:MAG TPA: hypothetical protein VLM40_11095, partial [Gemmata sp.]|nr:hypothetical protein [Gemmata sp.]
AALGCSHNPGYFPYLLPGGPIVETHAKPGGPGYFRDFDPKACKLQVTPNQQITAPLGSQIVLVGSVLDKDGEPRRSRRIEWLVEGPGNIVEADESGVFPGRGYKVDNKYAVTYTNYLHKTITRGNDDPGDDVLLSAGQTFCVLTSDTPGETVVTAYAPEVFNWESRRVAVKICWGEGRFSFPQPAVVRYGGEHTLTTTVSNTAADGVPNGYRIRYKVLDGPPAVLVSLSGTGTGASQSGTGSREAEAFTDANGAAAVRLVEQGAKPGKSRVAIEIVKPPESGVGAGTVVGRKETVIEWAEPKIQLAVDAPKTVGMGGTFPVTVSLDNDAAVESRDARVKITLSDGATLARSEPPPSRQDASGVLTFDLPPVGGNAKQEVTLQVKPAKLGQVTVTAEALTADGFQATNRATSRVDQGSLQTHMEGPSVALAGEQIPFQVAVTNPSPVPAENVTVWARFDAGLTSTSPGNPIELVAGKVAPGQTVMVDLPLTAKTTGKYSIDASVTGDGNLNAKAAPITVEVKKGELAAAAAGPKIVYLNQEAEWTVTVRNAGESPVANVQVRATVPAELRVKSASDDGRVGAGSVEWKIAELKAGEEKTLRLVAGATKLADRATLNVSVLGDAMSGTRTVGDPLEARSETATAIIGTPAIALELASPPGLLEVGKRAAFQVRVRNSGTVSARNVQVTAFAPAELRPLPVAGANPPRIEPSGKIAFPPVDELKPGQTLTFTINVEAAQAGDARFRAEVLAAHLRNPMKEEQAARVTGK